MAAQLLAQQLHRILHVLFAVVEAGFFAVLAPAAFADGLSNRRLVDVLPALDPIGATGVGEAFALPLPHFVRIIRQQNISGGEVGGVQIEDVYWKSPAQTLKHVISAQAL